MATKDHYVPQFYLKAWVDPSGSTPDPFLWVVDLRTGEYRRRSPKNVAVLTGFNDTEAGLEYGFRVEDTYTELESRASKVLKRLRMNSFRLNGLARYDLATFMGFQIGRVPSFRERALAAVAKLANGELKTFASDDQLVRMLTEWNQEHGTQLTADEVRAALPNMSVEIKPGQEKDFTIGVGLSAGQKFAPLIFAKRWQFLKAPKSQKFITADVPVAPLTPDARPPRNLESKELEFAFPISPNTLLFVHSHDGPPDDTITEVEREDVRTMNIRGVLSVANRYVFCSTEQQAQWVLKQRA